MDHYIKYWREEFGLTQDQLGELVNKNKGQISKLEKKKQLPKLHELEQIADALTRKSGEYFDPLLLLIDPAETDRLVRNDQERRMLNRFRQLEDKERTMLDAMMHSISSNMSDER